jgi:beta-glucosidase-like glycosyl hydrolase
MFKNAIKSKFRFETTKGMVSTEDLFDMPLSSRNGFDLDTVAITLDTQIKSTSDISFVKQTTTVNKELAEKLEIVKSIISEKLLEQASKQVALAKASQKEFLQGVLKEKQVDAVKSLSIEEIQEQLRAL